MTKYSKDGYGDRIKTGDTVADRATGELFGVTGTAGAYIRLDTADGAAVKCGWRLAADYEVRAA